MMDKINYNNNPKRRVSTMVLSMPGAGGPMLLELMALAGGTKVTGNQDNSFYHAITNIVESLSSNGSVYGPVASVSKEYEGLRFYARDTQEFDTNLTLFYLKNILLKTTSGAGLALTEALRDEDEGWVDRFCNAIRFMNDSSAAPFRVAFLVCDLSEITYSNPIEHNKRLQEFKYAMELGDMWIKKSDLMKNPKQVMLKLQCHTYPDEKEIERIMKKYERAI